MYVCLCNGITDREIRGAVALGVSTFDELRAATGVATCCGRCSDCARGILAERAGNASEAAGGDD